MTLALFYVLAAFILYSAFFVITARNLFRSAMGLIAVLIGVAGLYLLMDAQFLSAVQVAVYVGGIVVLIVYVILLVEDVTQRDFPAGRPWRKGLAGGLAAVLFAGLAWAILDFSHATDPGPERSASVAQIGRALLDPRGFLLPFEILSLILVAALIGALTVARSPEDEKRDEPPAPPAGS